MVRVETNLLLEAAKKARKAVRKSPAAIMQCLRFDVIPNAILISGYSSEMRVAATIPEITSDGESFTCFVNAATFLSIVGRMTSEDVEISQKPNNILFIKGGNVELNIPYLNDSEVDKRFGESKVVNPAFEAESDMLEPFINACGHALANKDMQHKQLESFHLEFGENNIRVTALDGMRASIRSNMENDESLQKEIVVKGSDLLQACSILKQSFTIGINDMFIKLSDDITTVEIPLVEGDFFNLDTFLNPKGLQIKASVERKALLEAIEITTLVSACAVIELNPTEGTIVCRSRNGENSVNIPVPAAVNAQDEKPIVIGLNGSFLSDCLKSIEEETVTLEIKSAREPIYIRGEGYLEFILPRTGVF